MKEGVRVAGADQPRTLRVGFVITASSEWLAVVQYYRNLWNAIALAGEDLEPVALVGEKFDLDVMDGAPGGIEVQRSPWLDARTPRWAARAALARSPTSHLPLEPVLRRQGIDVMSHSGPLGRFAHTPAISWIPDFQHVRLPEMFDSRERRLRDRGFRRICRLSDRVLVSSVDALGDLADFDPEALPRARVLRFVADPLPSETLPALAELESEYGFSGPYLHLPNQFWKHKNHSVVIEAVARLRARGMPILVLATGGTRDYRWPGHFEQLIAEIARLGVGDYFRIIGSVPYPHVAALMHHARAVVNPSLFEGWSTTVEEAKSTGARVVLSDLDVHREQDPPDGIFFDRYDPEACAEALHEAWEEHDPALERQRQKAAQTVLGERRRAFGAAYADIVREVVADRRPVGSV